jgi:Protein of unknown function (DUF4199)
VKRNQIFKYSITFGLIAGIACFLFFLAMYSMKSNPLSLRRPDIGINIIMIWAAIWYFKRNNGGFLHFYEGFSIGFLTNIIAALISGVLIFLFVEIVDKQPFITWIIEGKALMLREKETFAKILNDDNFRRGLLSLEKSKPSTIIYDDLMFKQFAIIPISLFSMAMRKLNN